MKWNKKTAKKRPSMWYQDGDKINSFYHGPRVRIVYPNGVVEWASLDTDLKYMYLFNVMPCYIAHRSFAFQPKNQVEAIKIMNKFDKQSFFPKAEFLGWL